VEHWSRASSPTTLDSERLRLNSTARIYLGSFTSFFGYAAKRFSFTLFLARAGMSGWSKRTKFECGVLECEAQA